MTLVIILFLLAILASVFITILLVKFSIQIFPKWLNTTFHISSKQAGYTRNDGQQKINFIRCLQKCLNVFHYSNVRGLVILRVLTKSINPRLGKIEAIQIVRHTPKILIEIAKPVFILHKVYHMEKSLSTKSKENP